MDPVIFVSDLQEDNLKIIFESIFTSFFKDKKSHRNHKRDKTVGIHVFLTTFA
jgi:hypothetical protein